MIYAYTITLMKMTDEKIVKIYVDGSSREVPKSTKLSHIGYRQAGIGLFCPIFADKERKRQSITIADIEKFGIPLDPMKGRTGVTNNHAELAAIFCALQFTLQCILKTNYKKFIIHTDSQIAMDWTFYGKKEGSILPYDTFINKVHKKYTMMQQKYNVSLEYIDDNNKEHHSAHLLANEARKSFKN